MGDKDTWPKHKLHYDTDPIEQKILIEAMSLCGHVIYQTTVRIFGGKMN